MNKDGFGHIKISPTFTLEEATAAVDEAKTLGMRITSHGGGVSDTTPTTMTRIAVQAGVQCIEHLNEMEDDVLDLMAQKGVYDVPTMAVYRDLYKPARRPGVLVEKRHWTQAMHENPVPEGPGAQDPHGHRDGRRHRPEALSGQLFRRVEVFRRARREPDGNARHGDEERAPSSWAKPTSWGRSKPGSWPTSRSSRAILSSRSMSWAAPRSSSSTARSTGSR